jgi:peptidoglycan L-alanyl-D-glutamate endopeptidase CwlK
MAIDGSNGTDHTSSTQSTASLSDSLAQEQTSAARTREQEIRTELTNNPQAVQALDKLTANLNCYNLTDEQKVQALDNFMAAPNAATANFVEGRIAQDLGVNLSTARSLTTPDAGTLTMNGQTYSIQDGALMDAQHRNVGTIGNDGTVQFNNEQQARSVYSDLTARVQLQDNVAGRLQTTLDLHPADARGRLSDPNLNQAFAQRVTQTLERARREGMDMQTNLGYRTFAQQDGLYAQGRTAPGNRVTNARGGQSWHNYGVAMDNVFSTPTGQPSWPDNGNWTRYGEIAQSNGLTWGGNWQSPDRPHVEYHPGFGTNAGGMVGTHAQSGLEGVWDRMGIGQQP